jgi:SAM-dependent methyltransferase
MSMELNEQEAFWRGEEGDLYIGRNPVDLEQRHSQRKDFFDLFENLDRDCFILEAGCNIAGNLQILSSMGFENLFGVDINQKAVNFCRTNLPLFRVVQGSVLRLPYPDDSFDVVFTSGVLIHQDPHKNLAETMKEIIRCSKNLIIGFEDYSDTIKNMSYRARTELHWPSPFSRLWENNMPIEILSSKVIDTGGSNPMKQIYKLAVL